MAARLDDEVTSTPRLPCRTSTRNHEYQLDNAHFPTSWGTHTYDLVVVARRVNPQYLDSDVATSMFAPPDISVSTAVQWGT